MDPKSAVVKSKSNSGISKKSGEEKNQDAHKKSRSNADFPLNRIKKRGVYVEKRLTKTNLTNDKKADVTTKKPPSRPRAGQKKFLASVLTILSKSTAGTQYPDTDDDEQKPRESAPHEKDKKYKNKPCPTKNKADYEEDATNITIHKGNKKGNFKSRVLSKKFVREDNKNMIVLQSRKEIAQTPSNYSEWSNKDPSQGSRASVYFVYDDLNKNQTEEKENTANDLRNAILEGRSTRKVKKLRYADDEPNTLVSDSPKDQKNLYNFFVDLLETTISVYNVKAEYDAAGPSDTSKTYLQINESVADKLKVGKDNKTTKMPINEVNVNPPYHLNFENELNNKDILNIMKTKPITNKRSIRELPFIKEKVKKLNTDSFIYPNKNKTVAKTSKSVEINRKTKFKNKSDLINVLKQELEVGTHVFEEPKSIFQALKAMARNKKKISFDTTTFTDECYLRRRKIISSRKSKKNKDKLNKLINKANDFNKLIKSEHDNRNNFKYKLKTNYNKKGYNEREYDESSHSLKVLNVDYASSQPKSNLNRSDDITLTYHSSNSEVDFDVHDAILNPASQYSSLRKF